MAPHPPQGVDDLDGDDLDVDLDSDESALIPLDRSLPDEHARAGGAGRELTLVLVLGGLLGLWASIALTIDYLHTLQDPDFVPACDLNPLIGCGVFLASEQSNVFGFPNILIGLIAYPVVITTGVLLAGRVRLPRWYWQGLLLGSTFGVVFVTWLQYQAFTSIRALCPYCVVIWLATIPIFVHTLARTVQNGSVPGGDGLRSLLVGNRWVITALWYLVVVAAAVLILWDKWLLVF